jgi:hypothetical protein
MNIYGDVVTDEMSQPHAKLMKTWRREWDSKPPIGFDVAINDNDEGKGPLKQQLHWSGMNDLYWCEGKFFGTLILYELPAIGKPETKH